MGVVKTSGIVLKTTKYGESSLIVTMLTRDFGKISAIANNVRTKKSALIGGLQLFAYSEIVTYKAKSKNGLYNLNEMNVLESFSGLRYDLDKMAYASYFAEVALSATGEEAPDEEILRLLLNVLYALDRGLESPEKIKAVFLWRIAAESGFMPLLDGCSKCHSTDICAIDVAEGVALCENCKGENPGLSTGLAKVINYISSADSKKIFGFSAGDETLAYISSLGDAYISAQLDREFKTLEYLKNIKKLGESNNGKTD